jgi:hypothetical protein
MKRSHIKFTLLLLPILVAIILGIGFIRGGACPPYLGEASYQLDSSTDLESIKPLLLSITGDYGGNYKRWAGCQNEEEGIIAYRNSLRYNINKSSDGYLLQVSSLADKDYVAVDAPAFPGRQAFYPLLRDGYLSDAAKVHRTTNWDRIQFGLGLFPSGDKLVAAN